VGQATYTNNTFFSDFLYRIVLEPELEIKASRSVVLKLGGA